MREGTGYGGMIVRVVMEERIVADGRGRLSACFPRRRALFAFPLAKHAQTRRPTKRFLDFFVTLYRGEGAGYGKDEQAVCTKARGEA